MTLSNNIHTFHDIERVLTSARAADGAVFTLSSPSAAIKWRARAYQYRRLLSVREDGAIIPTPWDDMNLQATGADIIITFGVPSGTLKSLDGAPLEIIATAKRVPATDPLLAAAAALLAEDE